MKRKVIIEWSDTPELLDSGNYMLEVTSVQPFKKPTHFGWILSLRAVEKKENTLQDWLTVQTEVEKFKWQIERTQKFLEHAGLTGSDGDPLTITHKDLIGVVVLAHVEKLVSKKTQQYYNRVKYYLPNDQTPALDEQF